MSSNETEIFNYAVKLLAQRDYSVEKLRQKLAASLGTTLPEPVLERLLAKGYLNDQRYAENHVSRHKKRGRERLSNDLLSRGIAPEVVEAILSEVEWPSLRDALTAKMIDWGLHAPLQQGEAARLFRAMARLGYEEDAIREEIEQRHHEQ